MAQYCMGACQRLAVSVESPIVGAKATRRVSTAFITDGRASSMAKGLQGRSAERQPWNVKGKFETTGNYSGKSKSCCGNLLQTHRGYKNLENHKGGGTQMIYFRCIICG